MEHLDLARSQMAFSLAFHIIFASISIVMPFLMTWSYHRYLKTKDKIDLALTKAWMKGAAVLFAIGAVSGTTLSFQLGLLWPTFMKHAGPIFGMPFSLEGVAFFLEAIFLGLFYYGWGRMSTKRHLFCGVMVGCSGLLSAILVVSANGWMNAPSGFDWVDGAAQNIDPWAAMFNSAWPLQAFHMVIAAFQATSIAAIGLHAWGLLSKKVPNSLHRRSITYLMPILVVSSLLQPIVGDLSAKVLAERQPEKLAAMEAHFHTQKNAPLVIGGIPDEETMTVPYSIEIPGLLSFLTYSDFDAEVKGLDAFPKDERPPVFITHLAFQIMVGIGMILLLLSLVYLYARWKKVDLFSKKWWLKFLIILTPTGFIALEAGWVVTEVGRQPWIIYKVMKTADSVTPVTGLEWSFLGIVILYTLLSIFTVIIIRKIIKLESKNLEVS